METPGTRTPEELFAGSPAALRLFSAVRAFVASLGPVKIRVMKTQISFAARTGFASVWLPQIWIRKQPDEGVVLSFALRRRIAAAAGAILISGVLFGIYRFAHSAPFNQPVMGSGPGREPARGNRRPKARVGSGGS